MQTKENLTQGSLQLNVLVYVDDDFIIYGTHCSTLASFKHYVAKCFYMKDLGQLKYFLGVEVARSVEGIFLCQWKYALDIVVDPDLLGARLDCFMMVKSYSCSCYWCFT